MNTRLMAIEVEQSGRGGCLELAEGGGVLLIDATPRLAPQRQVRSSPLKQLADFTETTTQ